SGVTAALSSVQLAASAHFSTLSLHDALPIYLHHLAQQPMLVLGGVRGAVARPGRDQVGAVHPHRWPLAGRHAGRLPVELPLVGPDRKSTRLNSSHQIISYAVFCLKKKTNTRH